MGFFGFLKRPDINQGVLEYETQENAVLLDVRTPEEYGEGHIPGSRNLPLQRIEEVEEAVGGKDVPLFVYCRSGARSAQAAHVLRQMGYEQVKDLGGILNWSGSVER